MIFNDQLIIKCILFKCTGLELVNKLSQLEKVRMLKTKTKGMERKTLPPSVWHHLSCVVCIMMWQHHNCFFSQHTSHLKGRCTLKEEESERDEGWWVKERTTNLCVACSPSCRLLETTWIWRGRSQQMSWQRSNPYRGKGLNVCVSVLLTPSLFSLCSLCLAIYFLFLSLALFPSLSILCFFPPSSLLVSNYLSISLLCIFCVLS